MAPDFRLHKKTQLEHYGICTEVIRLFCIARQAAAVDLFKCIWGSCVFQAALSVQGRTYVKEASTTEASNSRAILPRPAVLQITDAIISTPLTFYFDRFFPSIEVGSVGASPFTQTLDIAHGLQAVLGNGLDNKRCDAVAQQDIPTYCDSL